MKFIFLLAVTTALSSCYFNSIKGNGDVTTEKRTVGDFTGIAASSSFDVEVKMGSTPDVKVEADANLLPYIITEVENGVLRIRTKENTSISTSHLKVFVTATTLNKLKASASADIKVLDAIQSNSKVSFAASSSAGINASVDAPEVSADASSSGSITLRGTTKNYEAEVSSSGDINSGDLLAENTKVKANSSGRAHVHASVSLDAKASSSGSIKYRGGAEVKQNTSSSGSVAKE
jgi:hypothetical protein